jgi:hypothetical protein
MHMAVGHMATVQMVAMVWIMPGTVVTIITNEARPKQKSNISNEGIVAGVGANGVFTEAIHVDSIGVDGG